MRRAFAAVLMAFAGAAFGQASEIANPDPATEARLKGLAEELRCLVCQNQTIADSNAPLALDLRNQIRTQIGQGKSDEQIKQYLVARYTDFVLYQPRVAPTTWLLWFGPLLLLAAGAVVVARIVGRHGRGAPPAAQESEDQEW